MLLLRCRLQRSREMRVHSNTMQVYSSTRSRCNVPGSGYLKCYQTPSCLLRGLSQTIFPTVSVIMTLRGGGGGGGGGSEGLGCDANIHTLTLEDDVDVWLVKLVQGGYIPSTFHLTTHILSQRPNFCVS